MNRKHSYTENQFKDAVKLSTSIRQVLKRLKIVPAGGNYLTIKNYIKNRDIDTSHFLGQGTNRGINHKGGNKRKPLNELLIKGSIVKTHLLKTRLISEGIKEHKCEMCHLVEWQGNKIPLELDHINGDNTDNRLENLRNVCPNCHALTPTYRGRNIKSPLW